MFYVFNTLISDLTSYETAYKKVKAYVKEKLKSAYITVNNVHTVF